MNHNTWMRGPLARERARRLARTQSIVTPLLAAAVLLVLVLGAAHSDYNFLMAYGY